MKITFLGTGTSQGVPMIGCTCEVCQSMDYRDKRLRTSVHIEVDGQSFVIDTGPDFRQQMLRERINKLDAVIFTHSHKDHIAGLDDVRAFNYLQKKDMPVYATAATIRQLKAEFYYAFEEIKYPGTPQITLHEIDDNPFNVNGVTFTPLPVLHMHMPVMGFRVRNFSYITDAKTISKDTIEKMKGSEVLVLNALQKESHVSHFTLSEALEIVEIIGASKTYFTHMSHRMGLHKAIEKELPDSVALAYDGLTITL